MISIEILRDMLDFGLNMKLEEFPDGAFRVGRTEYQFHIVTGTGNYRKPEKMQKDVGIDADGEEVDPYSADAVRVERRDFIRAYINGVLTLSDSMIDTTAGGRFNATMSTRLDLGVPIINPQDDNEPAEIASTVREILTQYFSANQTGYIYSDATYSYGVEYTLPEDGIRSVPGASGDMILMSVDATFFFIEGGANSKDYRLFLDGEDDAHLLLCTLVGFSRSYVQESTVPADSPSNVTKYTDSSSVFSVNFDLPVSVSGVGEALQDELFTGDKMIHLLSVERPSTEEGHKKTHRYLVSLAESNISATGVQNAGQSVTLREAHIIDVVNPPIPLTTVALAYYNGEYPPEPEE